MAGSTPAGDIRFSANAATELALTTTGIPSIAVKPDTSEPILYVDVYYTQQGQMNGQQDYRDNTMNQFAA